ncbi:MAG: hypothetical protein LBD86_06765 [Spirochaetaceae bacterium]|nr:hypothetical protein [Spirochaetaceae bacterium]
MFKRFYYATPTPVRTGLFALIVLLCCPSCDARLDTRIYSNGRAEIMLKSALLPGAGHLLKSLSAAGGGPVFDAAVLNRNFAAIPGVESSALRNTGLDGLEGGIFLTSLTLFLNGARGNLAQKNGAGKFSAIVLEQSASGGTLTINLNMDTGQEFLLLISPDMVDYLSALMAPVATGELISRDAYLELVASVYGKAVADEIRRTQFFLKFELPGPVENVRGGTGKGSHAEFTIPLTDLLVLDQPLYYEVRWTPWR